VSHRRGPVRGPLGTAAAHDPRMVDRVHHIFPLKKIPHWKIHADFAVTPCPSVKSSRSQRKFQEDPWFSKIILDMALATYRNYKKVPATSFHHSFATVTPILTILAQNSQNHFLFHLMHSLTHVCCILIDCVLAIR
jgi:hypothetical protein